MAGVIASVMMAVALMIGSPGTAPESAPVDYSADAYASYDALELGVYETSVPMVLDYVETVNELPIVASVNGLFVVESITQPGRFHVMKWSVLTYA